MRERKSMHKKKHEIKVEREQKLHTEWETNLGNMHSAHKHSCTIWYLVTKSILSLPLSFSLDGSLSENETKQNYRRTAKGNCRLLFICAPKRWHDQIVVGGQEKRQKYIYKHCKTDDWKTDYYNLIYYSIKNSVDEFECIFPALALFLSMFYFSIRSKAKLMYNTVLAGRLSVPHLYNSKDRQWIISDMQI